jgi:methylisocitrate lyase
MTMTVGGKFRELVAKPPLLIVGVADGSDALEAEKAGFKAIYLSGSQVAASRGWADIGRLKLRHILEAVERIKDSGVKLPLLVDIDTGFDDAAETIRQLEKLGVAAVHIEDQQDLKACGHLPDKTLTSKEEAVARIERAVKAKKDPSFVIMARTDALAIEGIEKTLTRISAYAKAGADMVFAEAFPDVATYGAVKKASGGLPVLANMTEFGKVPLKTPEELAAESNGNVDIVLLPLTVYRAQRKTAAEMYKELFDKSTQKYALGRLQQREDFKNLIGYDDQVKARGDVLKKKLSC